MLQLIKCEICSRHFSFQKVLDSHFKRIHKKDWKCPEPGCTVAFRAPSTLKNHYEQVHRRFKINHTDYTAQCDVCKEIFKTNASLHIHKKLKHKKNYERRKECKICLESFSAEINRTKHYYHSHRNGAMKLRKCFYCSSEFKLTVDFEMHIRSHEGIFICDICGAFFGDKKDLFLHRESHKHIEQQFKQFVSFTSIKFTYFNVE